MCIITTVACLWGALVAVKHFKPLVLEWNGFFQNNLRISHIIHLLDRFLIIAHSQSLCQDELQLFLDLCSYHGIPIAPEKL